MLKKLTAILLSITLLLTLCPSFTGVLAATSYQTENFDGAAVGNYAAFNSLGLTDTMLSTDSTEEIFKIVEGVGADGETTKMLEMKSPTAADAVLKFPAFDYTVDAGVDYTFSFKFCLEELPAAASEFTTTNFMSLFRSTIGFYSNNTVGVASDGVIPFAINATGSNKSNLKEKTWYKAEFYIQDNDDDSLGANAGGYMSRAMYEMDDEKTNSNLPTAMSRQIKKASGTVNTISDIFVLDLKQATADGNGFVVRIDDVEFRSFNPTTDGATIRKSTIANGSSVSAGTTEATIVFDQVLNAASVKLTSGGTELTAPTLTYVSNTLNTATYTLSGLNLEEGKAYTLDFSGCTNASGIASSETISFTTQSGAPIITANSLTEGAEISPIAATATVTFDQALSGDSKVVVYEEGGENQECTLTLTSGTTYTVTLPDLEDGKAYTLDFTGCKNAGGVPCSATVNFTTKVVRMVKLTDNFETNLIDDTKAGYKGYNTSNDASSPLYSQNRNKGGVGDMSSLVPGYNGNALQISTVKADNDSDDMYINALRTNAQHTPEVNPANAEEYEQFVLTYRLNIKKKADFGTTQHVTTKNLTYDLTGTSITFYTNSTQSQPAASKWTAAIENLDDGSLVITAKAGENNVTAPVEEDHWYNVVWSINGRIHNFNLIDGETGELVFTYEKELDIPTGGHMFTIYNGNRTLNSTAKTITNQNQTVLIDDFTFWKIKPWMNEQKLTANVSGVNTTYMIFNQPVIATRNMLDVYKDVNKENVVPSAKPQVTYPDFCEMSVSYKGLRYMTDYTVDYSAISSAGGAGFASSELATKTYTFTIGTDPLGLTLIGDIEYTSLEKDSVVTANMQKDEAGTATLILAFYKEDSLLGVALKNNTAFSANVSTPVEFALSSDMTNADAIKVFAWDSLSTITPLMTAYVD